MINKENASISVFLACLALLAVVSGLWVTRPVAMDLWVSLSGVVVIYSIVAGAPQILILAAAVSSARQGLVLAAGWWAVANLVFALQVGGGAMLIAGALISESRLLVAAATVLVVAALTAVAGALAASRVGWQKSDAAQGSQSLVVWSDWGGVQRGDQGEVGGEGRGALGAADGRHLVLRELARNPNAISAESEDSLSVP